MLKTLLPLIKAFVISAFVISCGYAQPVLPLSASDNLFAFDLYSRLASGQGNILFSPYSLSNALDMAYEGARGITAQQMRTVLHLSPDELQRRQETSSFMEEINRADKTYELSVANALWAQKASPFKEDYVNLVKKTYFAQVRNLDFVSNPGASRVTINLWVSDNTHHRINDLLPGGSITPDTRLVLTDAVYFKGKWMAPFNKEDTAPDAFWLNSGHSVQTDMMSLKGISFDYMDNDQVQVLQLPYQGDELSMLIVLPRVKDIQKLEKALTLGELKHWQEGMINQKVNVVLPKFKFDSSYEMGDVLAGMGMKLAFDKKEADFSGMTPNKGLYIDQVYHKAWIEVNEEGTEASAATAVGMALLAMRVEPVLKIFRADHPFLFVVQENKTGHILFMGRVSDPRELKGHNS